MAGRPNAEDEDDEDPVGGDETEQDAFRFQPGDDDGAGEQEADAAPYAEQEDGGLKRERSRRDYRDEARAAREQTTRLEAELQQLRAQVNQAQQPREPTDQEFENQIAALPQEEQSRYRSYRQEQKFQRALQTNALQTRDYIDRSSFESKAGADPDRKRLAPRVEQVLQNWRSAGLWQANREDAYYWLKGQLSEQNRGKIADSRRQSEDRNRRQQGYTQGSRSDRAPQSRGTRRYAPDDMSPEAVRQRLLGPDGRGVII